MRINSRTDASDMHGRGRILRRTWVRKGRTRAGARDPFDVLGVERGADLQQVRKAYVKLMKTHHPDVNGGRGNRRAADIIQAYQTVVSMDEEERMEQGKDVFEVPDGPPVRIFVNPFACRVDPMQWRELLQVAKSNPNAPEEALRNQGVYCSEWAVQFLSPKQFERVEAEMVRMEYNLSFEQTSWVVDTYLLQAREANKKAPLGGWNKGDGEGFYDYPNPRYEADGYR